MRFNILLETSSIPHEIREMLRELEGDLFEYEGFFMNKWDYVMMHQLTPVLDFNPRNMNDINSRLNMVMADDKL